MGYRPPLGYRLRTVSAPAAGAVLLSRAKEHLTIEPGFTDDDDLISDYLDAAQEHVERVTNRRLITQTVEMILDAVPVGAFVTLPGGTCQSVDFIKYRDEQGAEQTWPDTEYRVDLSDEMAGTVFIRKNGTWPDIEDDGAAFWIRFTVGYGAAAADVPAAIRGRIMEIASDSYQHRGSVVTSMSVADLRRTKLYLAKFMVPHLS